MSTCDLIKQGSSHEFRLFKKCWNILVMIDFSTEDCCRSIVFAILANSQFSRSESAATEINQD